MTFAAYSEAVVPDSQQAVVAVIFFRDGEFVAATTNAPYRLQLRDEQRE